LRKKTINNQQQQNKIHAKDKFSSFLCCTSFTPALNKATLKESLQVKPTVKWERTLGDP
jgi:hypothetical protein